MEKGRIQAKLLCRTQRLNRTDRVVELKPGDTEPVEMRGIAWILETCLLSQFSDFFPPLLADQLQNSSFRISKRDPNLG